MEDFALRAALAGLGVALTAGPLGCFVIWRRMAYFGDATAHAALLGVALALISELPVTAGVLAIALGMAITLTLLAEKALGQDAILGVLAHGALAIGLVALALVPGVRVNIESYLFGDILAVFWPDLWVIWCGTFIVLAMLAWRWQSLLTATLNPDLARAEGIDPRRETFILTCAMALTVAVSLKVVGALLIASMLVIPAATARSFARNPESMALAAIGVGILAVAGGLWGSFRFDTPTGPSIVTAALLLFALSRLSPR